jgi:hypothetical protein
MLRRPENGYEGEVDRAWLTDRLFAAIRTFD